MTQLLPTPSPEPRDLYRLLPQVEKALHWPELRDVLDARSHESVVEALRAVLDRLREDVRAGRVDEASLQARIAPATIARSVRAILEERDRSAYRRVINATGVLLHTGLGRAVLSEQALRAFAEAAAGYSLVEVDPETGERSLREQAVARLLCELTGAESATVVNNNAAATLLILATLARGREVIISRGQLVEIGGSYRIPDVLRESGARLVEVGTTNRTYARDYRQAIGPETGLLLSVHTSNYEIVGFSHHTPLEELVALGKEHGIPVVSDLGSGCFVDVGAHGFRPEPLVTDSIRAGADLACFSGDKLLGGPQSGIIVGGREMVARTRAHPLFRTLRVDKVTLILLEATLRAYREPSRLWGTIPLLRAISEGAESVRSRAEGCRALLRQKAPHLDVDLIPSTAQAGSGALPAQEIPSFALAVSHPTLPPLELARRLRTGTPAVFPRVQSDKVLLDFRSVLEGESEGIVTALTRVE